MKDDCKTLEELRVSKGAKMMVVGSTVTDVMEVATSVPGTDVKQREEAIGWFTVVAYSFSVSKISCYR